MEKITKEDIATIEQLMKLMTENMVDAIEIGNIKLLKTQHIPSDINEKDSKPEVEDEDLLFYSAQ